MATLKEPFALDRSFNTTEDTPRSIADVLAEELSRITGRNASQVEYDNTESGLTADNVQDALDEIAESVPTLPTTDIQTAVDEFETYNGGLLSECKVSLSPNQNLHGYDSPWVGGAGKNKCDWKVTPTSDALSIALSPNTYTISAQSTLANGNWYFRFTDNNNNYITDTSVTGLTSFSVAGSGWMYGGNSSQVVTFIIPSNCILLEVGKLNSDGTIPAQIEIGSTATVYEPYSNICPISGHTQVDVDVSDGQTTQEQITVNLGGTYYSGTLDVVSGVFTPDTADVDLGTLTWTYHDSSQVFYSADITDESRILAVTCDCEGFKPVVNKTAIAQMTEDGTVAFYSGDAYHRTYVKCSLYTDAVAFKSAVSGIKLVYKLATPTPIQLSPTMVKALVGENHLSAPLEGQEITESKYRELFTWDEVEAYVNAHSGGGSGMNYSTEEQVVGTWFGKTLYQKTVDQTIGSDADYTVFANGIAHAHLVNSIFEYSSGRWFSSGYTSIGVTSNSRTCYVEVQNGALNLHNQSNFSIHWIATIQYTKTTD